MAQWDQIDVDGSPMRLYVGMPSLGRAFPAVIVIQHGPGVDASSRTASSTWPSSTATSPSRPTSTTGSPRTAT